MAGGDLQLGGVQDLGVAVLDVNLYPTVNNRAFSFSENIVFDPSVDLVRNNLLFLEIHI